MKVSKAYIFTILKFFIRIFLMEIEWHSISIAFSFWFYDENIELY